MLADAYRIISIMDETEVLNFFIKFISENTTIPVILTGSKGKIKNTVNVDFDKDTVAYLNGSLRDEFIVYPPVKISYEKNQYDFLYYKDSKLFTELRVVLDDIVESFFSEVVINAASVPVIITDSTKTKVLAYGSLDPKNTSDTTYILKILKGMADDNDPIEIELADQGKRYIFYKDSDILTRLIIFPYFQLSVIALFLFITYIIFSSERRSEQNQVWVGLAKDIHPR